MPKVIIAQLKLRRAFRYGYFAFVAGFLALLILFGIAAADGLLGGLLAKIVAACPALLWAALVLALSVPLFFACWSLIGSAMLSRLMREGVTD